MKILPSISEHLDSDGVWRQLFTEPRKDRPPALFLDRDGVIVEETVYLSRVEDVALIAGAADAIAAANHRSIPVVIVCNQAGIGRGYYGWNEFAAVQRAMLAQLARLGAHVDSVFACAHHPEGVAPYAHPDHPARKPRPGMLLQAAESLEIDPERSWIIGDKTSDLEAGCAAGLGGGVLVLTGHGVEHRSGSLGIRAISGRFDVQIANSISEAKQYIPFLR